jgi:hypothetical protein
MPFDDTGFAPIATVKAAADIAGSLGYPSKMPGTAYGIPAAACHVGAKLHNVPDTVCSDCYALKGNYTFPSVAAAQGKRLAAIDNPRWVPAMVKMLRHAHGLDTGKPAAAVTSPGWHRWHDSGDLQSVAHLVAICDVARSTPELRHWLPTREVGVLAAFEAAGHVIPENLTVRVSATKIDGAPSARHAQTSSVYHKAAPRAGAHVCPAYLQGGVCGACRACWSRDVAEVAYPRH